jgi:ATP-dependent RNA helicase DDX54/DBP10
MDLTMDDETAMRRQKASLKRKHWDRKKMKFVGENEKTTVKKIKNESGQWITASYKTDRYKKWKKASKMDHREEEFEDGDNEESRMTSRAPVNVNPAMGFRKTWHTKNDKEKKIQDGVKSKDLILKTRLKKDAKKSYQLYRAKMNKKKRNK